MRYYKQKLYLAEVDINDNIIGKIERWQAHKKGVLHRGFTVILTYQDKIILQHRKHPAFDGYFDLTSSSHQIYKNEILQNNLEAIYKTLKREWYVDKSGLKSKPKFLGKIYYKACDPKSIYIEQEIDYIYKVGLKKLPTPNFDFAYGFKLINKLKTRNLKLEIRNFRMAPWVRKMIKEGKI